MTTSFTTQELIEWIDFNFLDLGWDKRPPKEELPPTGETALGDGPSNHREYMVLTAIRTKLLRLNEIEKEREWRDISSAPLTREWVLLKYKDDLSQHDPTGEFNLIWHNGQCFVGRREAFSVLKSEKPCWGMYGHGGIPDQWLQGWMPLPPALTPERKQDE